MRKGGFGGWIDGVWFCRGCGVFWLLLLLGGWVVKGCLFLTVVDDEDEIGGSADVVGKVRNGCGAARIFISVEDKMINDRHCYQ